MQRKYIEANGAFFSEEVKNFDSWIFGNGNILSEDI